ncbi:MAG: MATE family efflux transporter [Bacteroides sp.]|nr:MATE family efflux transporter [Bacteroides sp.]
MNHTKTATSGDVKRLGSGPIGRLLWDYSIPAVVGMLVMSLYNVVDRVFIGQGVGPDGITGLAITFPVMNISAALGVLIGSGASARVSILLGSKDEHGAEMTLGNSLTLIVVNAVVYLSLMWIFLDDILRLFGADEASLPYAHDYLIYLLPGMLLMNTGFSLNNVMRASGYPVKAMNSMFIGAGLNVVLDALFIFVLDMGIKGAAIATDISMGVFALFVLRHFSLRSSTLHFRRHSFRLHRKIVWGIIGIGAAPSLVNFASCLINIIINKSLYEYGGNNAVAAAGIFVTYTSLICMTVVGLCQGMQPIVGYNFGAGNYGRLRRAYWLAVGVATAVVSVGAVVGLTVPHLIARAFNSDPELIRVTSNAFSIAMVCFWVVGFQIVSTTFFQSIGKVGKSIFLSLSRQVLFLIPLLLILKHYYHLDGVWMSFPVSDMFATLVTVVLIVMQFRKLDKSRNCSNHEAEAAES